MSAGIGAEAAQRVRKMQESVAAKAAQFDRDEAILKSECVPFFEAVSAVLKESATRFNAELNLEGRYALTFVSHPSLIELGKKTSPTLLRKVVHFHAGREVSIHTDVSDHYRVGLKQEKWRFTVERGELLLNGMNVLESAAALFEGIPEMFS
jgi:hypothetical protein